MRRGLDFWLDDAPSEVLPKRGRGRPIKAPLTSDGKRDRRAYMRDYMRKKRATSKETISYTQNLSIVGGAIADAVLRWFLFR